MEALAVLLTVQVYEQRCQALEELEFDGFVVDIGP